MRGAGWESERPGSRSRLAGALALAVTLAVPVGLALAMGGYGESTAPRLRGGAESLDALGEAVWAGIVARDTAALERLRLSEEEHNVWVWPEQPAAAEPSAAANLDLWWGNIDVRSRTALGDLLGRYGGSTLPLRGVGCRGQPRDFATYRALTDCHLILGGADGEHHVQAFRYVVVMDGRYKAVRYHGDE